MSDHVENITGKKTDRDLISIIVPCYNEEKLCLHFTGQPQTQ